MVLKLIVNQQPLRNMLIFCHFLSAFSRNSVNANDCDNGQDVIATVKENSPPGTFIANLSLDPSASHMNLRISGKDAAWFYLDGSSVRLNSSASRNIDREEHGSVLSATLRCYKGKVFQAEYRISVKILNENDNKPQFLQSSTQPLQLSELTAVNSVVFTVQASDPDGDLLTYIIDERSPDASYFRLDTSGSGRVILNKPLDFESRTLLGLTVHAVETETHEHHNTTASIIISVTDGDDQYPQFLPCILLSANHSKRICANPIYTANITENEQDVILDFCPGPIQAVDGDEGLRTPLKYSILSGADHGRFVIDSRSGEVQLTRAVTNRLLMPTLRLRIMAAQTDDPLKYAVATVLVRVLAENRFPPQFDRSVYRGFVEESSRNAALVLTYSGRILMLEALDRDFPDGLNPRLMYSLSSRDNSSELFSITQEGFLIAKSPLLHPGHKYTLQVLATDLESGDTVQAVLHVELLQNGHTVPQGPFGVGRVDASRTVGRAEGLAGLCLILLVITSFALVQYMRTRREKTRLTFQSNVAESRHPNVSLKCFSLVKQSGAATHVQEHLHQFEAFGEHDSSMLPFYGKHGTYTRREDPQPSFLSQLHGRRHLKLRPNGRPVNRFRSKALSFREYVVVREWDEDSEGTIEESCTDLDQVSISAAIENSDSDSKTEEPMLCPHEVDKFSHVTASKHSEVWTSSFSQSISSSHVVHTRPLHTMVSPEAERVDTDVRTEPQRHRALANETQSCDGGAVGSVQTFLGIEVFPEEDVNEDITTNLDDSSLEEN